MPITDIWKFISEGAESVSSATAFIYGAILTLVLVLLVLIWALIRQRRSEQCVTVPHEDGDLVVTVNAVKEFVSRVVDNYAEASLRQVNIKSKRGTMALKLRLAVVPDTQIVSLTNRIRQQLKEKAGKELGIEDNLRIDVIVKSLSAKERTHKQKDIGKTSSTTEEDTNTP